MLVPMNWKAFALGMFLSFPALAEEVPPPKVLTYPAGEDKITVVHKGDAAPYTGQLFDDSTAIRWAMWLQQYKTRYSLDMGAAQESCAVRLDSAAALQAIEKARTTAVEADLRQRLKEVDAARLTLEQEVREPGFFKSPAFWYGVGVVTTVAAAVTTSLALK